MGRGVDKINGLRRELNNLRRRLRKLADPGGAGWGWCEPPDFDEEVRIRERLVVVEDGLSDLGIYVPPMDL